MKTIFFFALLFPFAVLAADYTLVLREHRFEPAELIVPSGVKIKLVIDNLDATAEEFDSHALNREKPLAGNSRTTLYLGPLDAGRYSFDGELHEDTARGVLIAR